MANVINKISIIYDPVKNPFIVVEELELPFTPDGLNNFEINFSQLNAFVNRFRTEAIAEGKDITFTKGVYNLLPCIIVSKSDVQPIATYKEKIITFKNISTKKIGVLISSGYFVGNEVITIPFPGEVIRTVRWFPLVGWNAWQPKIIPFDMGLDIPPVAYNFNGTMPIQYYLENAGVLVPGTLGNNDTGNEIGFSEILWNGVWQKIVFRDVI